jgi:hypothetical protein
MVEHVPHAVKMYWAEELSAVGRAEWVTEALKKHFFPKLEYEGRLPRGRDEGSVEPDQEAAEEEKILKDVKDYVEALRQWDVDATTQTKFIKKETILKAFDGVSFVVFCFQLLMREQV